MKTDKISFTGYDARPLRALLMRDAYADTRYESLIKELSAIGREHSFDVFVQDAKKVVNGNMYSAEKSLKLPILDRENVWLQDNMTISPNGKMFANFFADRLNMRFASFLKLPLFLRNYHLQGGNFFFIKDKGKTSLLLGVDDIIGCNLGKIRQDFDLNEIYTVSQPDFHLDLGLRPLKNKTVLLNDDRLTLAELEKGIKSAENYEKTSGRCENNSISGMLKMIRDFFVQYKARSINENSETIETELKNYGFKVVRVPSNIIRPSVVQDIDSDNHYMSNFMNAIVHQNKQGDLVYITNRSLLDEAAGITKEVEEAIGFGFHKMFRDSVKDYIKPENVYFLDGNTTIPQFVENYQGGIHCLCAEIPKIFV